MTTKDIVADQELSRDNLSPKTEEDNVLTSSLMSGSGEELPQEHEATASTGTTDAVGGEISKPKESFPWRKVLLFPFKLCWQIIVWISLAVWWTIKYSSITAWLIIKYSFFTIWWLVKFAAFIIVFCFGIFSGFMEILGAIGFGGVGAFSDRWERKPGETYGEYQQRIRDQHNRDVESDRRARKGSFRLAGKIWRSLWGISEEEEEE